MKLLHIADLHIGKRVNEFSMLEDQAYILDQIVEIAKEEKPSGILIAGDVYDKTQPSAEAVELLDEFLTKLVNQKLPVFMISGNHDSPERLGFGNRIMEKNNLHIAGVFEGTMVKKVLADEYGNVNIYMLPFIKPAHVRPFFEEMIESYEDAVRIVLMNTGINTTERNILISHQFVTWGGQKPEQSESEIAAIGGLDNIDASLFEDFDYVALGHLHGPQRIYRDNIRYAGSPLKYSFSETRQHKTVTLLEMGRKEDYQIRLIPLLPRRDMREIKGPMLELLKMQGKQDKGCEDYIRAVLIDEEEVYDAVGKLRQVYPNLMSLSFENSRTVNDSTLVPLSEQIESKNPLQLFNEFYKCQNNAELSKKQEKIMQKILEEAGGVS